MLSEQPEPANGVYDDIARSLVRSVPADSTVRDWIEARATGNLDIVDSALYQSLYRLEARRAITADWGVTENNRRARYYSITPVGRAELRNETARWNRYAETVTTILNTPQPA